LIFRIVMIAVSVAILSISTSFATTIRSVYHIKFRWKTEKKPSIYYEMTTYIYKSMRKEGVFLYSEYGNLKGVYIYLSMYKSYDKLEKIIVKANSKYIVPVIDHNSALKTPLHNILSGTDYPQVEPACQIQRSYKFNTAKAGFQFRSKLQDLVLERGRLISMEYIRKTRKEFDIKFSFLADCESKEVIMNNLSRIISRDHTEHRQLY